MPPLRKRNADAMSAALEVAMTPQKQMKTARVASAAASSAASTAASPAPSSAASSADSTAASPAASPAASRAVSPAPAPQNVPRAVAQIRARHGQQVAKLNVDNMFGEMTAKEVNAFQNNFRNSLTKQQKGDFSAATRADKRTWMLQWILDPALCQKEGFNVTKTYDTTESRAEDRWVTKEIMSSSRCLNSEAHADALIKSGELEERPHRFGALAAQGILEYLLTDEVVRRLQGHSTTAGVKATSELADDEFEEVKKSMEPGAPRTARKKAKETTTIDPATKQLRDANLKRSSVLRHLKGAIDKAEGYMASTTALIAKLETKGYPPAMLAFYGEKASSFQTSITTTKEAYATHVLKQEQKDTSRVGDVAKDTQMIEQLASDLGGTRTAFDKQWGQDVKKLGA